MIVRLLKHQIAVLVVLSLGVYFAFTAWSQLDLGSFRRMGPGFFPLSVGILLCCLAVIQFLIDMREHTDVGTIDLRSLLPVVSAVAAFCLLTPLFGVLPAIMQTSFLEVVQKIFNLFISCQLQMKSQ